MADSEQKTDVRATAPVAPVTFFKKRGDKNKANLRKRKSTPPPPSDSDDSDFSSSEDETGQRVKRRKRNTGVIVASSKDHAVTERDDFPTTVYEADREVSLDTTKRDATKHSNWYDEDTDPILSAKNLLGSTRAMQNKRQQHPEETKTSGPQRTVGPVKAPTNIRTITITDMAPDVCKDYKQTGFCGFGDTCKFLHAREDYAYGWQLDKEWENVTKGKKVLGGTIVASVDRKTGGTANEDGRDEDEEEARLLESIPFACFICKGPYQSPIVTRCGHYFCEECALRRYRKDPSCAACGAGTNGVFNAAKRLQKLLEKKREREKRKRQEAREAGEEVSDEEEDED
mgnify:CR=1 FL=1|jgi:Uncharacterized conserved protein, contains RING and CCCH-type Zn-fingers